MFCTVLFVVLFTRAVAYREEVLPTIGSEVRQLAISSGCHVISDVNNGTRLMMHDATNSSHYSALTSDILVVNENCDIVLFGYPNQNRVSMWKPFLDIVVHFVPNHIVTLPESGASPAVFLKEYPTDEMANVTRVPVSNTVDRFGFSLDIQGRTWVVGAPGTSNSLLGQGGTPGYAFVFQDEELHSCRSIYEMSCYPESTGCVSGLDNWLKYYGKLKSNWASHFIPSYQNVPWHRSWGDGPNETKVLHISDVKEVQKLCLPLEKPYYKENGAMLNEVYDAHRETSQQFGYSVSITGDLRTNGSSLYIGAPGDTKRFMENGAGVNYGRVYVWDNLLWPDGQESNTTLSWWQPNARTPLQLPLELATYQAFGREIAASRETLAVSVYPLYEQTSQPFIVLFRCRASLNDVEAATGVQPRVGVPSDCVEVGGLSIDDVPGNPLEYLGVGDITYLDGKTNWEYVPVPANDFQNQFIGANIGVVGSNVIVADPKNNKVYRFGTEGGLREQHTTFAANGHSDPKTAFSTLSQHWLVENGDHALAHYWECPSGYVGAQKECKAAPHGYYSNDGWLLYSSPCPRNYTTYHKASSVCIPWSAPLVPGLTTAMLLIYMASVVGFALTMCGALTAWQCWCVGKAQKELKYDVVPKEEMEDGSGTYTLGKVIF